MTIASEIGYTWSIESAHLGCEISTMHKFNLILATFLAFLLINEVSIRPQRGNFQEWLTIDSSIADARSSGGRSRGGSFSRPSRSTPSRSSGSSSPRRSSGSNSSPGSSTSDFASPAKSFDSTPATNTVSPTSPPSRGQTGGRVRGGSFEQPTMNPEAVIPNSPTSPTTRKPPSTGTTYAPTPSGSQTNIIVVPSAPVVVPAPVPQPSVAPGYSGSPGNHTEPFSGNVSPHSATVAPSNASSAQGFPWGWLLLFLVIGGVVAIAWYLLSKKNSTQGTAKELENDIVTVTKLQIALLANARDLQSQLQDLSYNADLETPEGRVEFLQEAALSLLRHPEYWSHVLASSQTVKSREQAAQIFEQLSIAERSKFSAETFSKVQGQVRKTSNIPSSDAQEPAAYIVVTLLIGTEDDQPLFGPISSTAELQQALQRVATITQDYLLVVELLWTPQEATDSLSYEQLLTGYADLVQL